MLRFFRQIRQRLFPIAPDNYRDGTENKFSKYLLYVIVEIFIVIIGILIALQIDNWNESKLSKKAMKEALKEVREDLVIDTAHLKEVIEIRLEDLDSQERIISTLEERKEFSEQTYRDLGRVMLHRQTKLLTNGYELLHEQGISNLNNKELRSNLVEYYEWTHSWIEKELEDDNLEFSSIWLTYVRENFSKYQFGNIGIPQSDNALKGDSYILMSLQLNQYNHASTLEAHQYALKKAGNLIEMIDNFQKK